MTVFRNRSIALVGRASVVARREGCDHIERSVGVLYRIDLAGVIELITGDDFLEFARRNPRGFPNATWLHLSLLTERTDRLLPSCALRRASGHQGTSRWADLAVRERPSTAAAASGAPDRPVC